MHQMSEFSTPARGKEGGQRVILGQRKKWFENVQCSWLLSAKAVLLHTGIWYSVHRQNKYKLQQNREFVNRGNESSKVTRKTTNRKGYYKNKEMKYLPPFL